MAREIVRCAWDTVGATLDAKQTPWVEFQCGICKQRVAEEFHSLASTTYHQVAEEECVRLRDRVAILEQVVRDQCERYAIPLPLEFYQGLWVGKE